MYIMSKKIIILSIVIIVGVASLLLYTAVPINVEKEPLPVATVNNVEIKKEVIQAQTVIATGLEIPWEIVFLPDGDMLVTERPGTIKRIGKDGRTFTIEGVQHVGEGGLLGMTLHPSFASNHLIYLYATTASGEGLKNRVERYRFENNTLTDRKIIIDGIPGAKYHDGGRIAFGPDGYLYITAGDAQKTDYAQDPNSLAGKILRLKDDGSIPADNPFNNATYSYGHRNPQGLAWDSLGNLWATEHGQSTRDELNLILKGKNYGWPVISGIAKKEGMESPVVTSGDKETWAPAGAVFLNGSIFFGGLKGEALYEVVISNAVKSAPKVYFKKEFGRIRAVVLGPDGMLYLTTSNGDGRGKKNDVDDRIIRINPVFLK